MNLPDIIVDQTPPVTVPADIVRAALADAATAHPTLVSPIVGRAIARGSDRTRGLRLERLARVVMVADPRITDPVDVWTADWSKLTPATVEQFDRAITANWQAAATRNAMRDSVRAVIRAGWSTGAFDAEARDRLLAATAIEKLARDEDKATRGHLTREQVTAGFEACATDNTPVGARDAAVLALLVGAGLRRGELRGLHLDNLTNGILTVTGKGAAVRDVPLPPGVRRAVEHWLTIRGEQPGPLITSITRTLPRTPTLNPVDESAVRRIVRHRLGDDVSPHDLRRTFVGDILDRGADLSTVSKIVGHSNPATTAAYDRRGIAARQAAMDSLDVPYRAPTG